MWRGGKEMTESGKEARIEEISEEMKGEVQVRVENEIKELLRRVDRDTKDEAKPQRTVEEPAKLTDIVENGFIASSLTPADLEGNLEEMRKLKNERRFGNRPLVREGHFEAWKEKNPEVVRKFSTGGRHLARVGGKREPSMKIQDILGAGTNPVSLGWI
jgi:hypothetical protein